MFGRLLRWYTMYTFRRLLPLTEFCNVQYLLRVQDLRSPVLAALLHGTRAVGVSQTLRRGTRNGITELSLLCIFNRGHHLHSEGGHHVGHRPTFLFLSERELMFTFAICCPVRLSSVCRL